MLLAAADALADRFEPAACDKEAYAEAKGALGAMGGRTFGYEIYTCRSVSDYYETLVVVTWGEADRQEVQTGMGVAAADTYGAALHAISRTLTLKYPCANRFEEPAQTCVDRWVSSETLMRFQRRERLVDSPRAKQIEAIEGLLARGEIRRAHGALAGVETNTGHVDEGNALLLMFMRGAHRAALKAHKARKKTRAATLVKLAVLTPPVMDGGDGPQEGEVKICLGAPGACEKYVDIGTGSADVQMLTDMGFFLGRAGEAALAAALLKQITAHFPENTPAWLNLGDAYDALGQAAQARAALEKYAALRKAQGRKLPERVRARLGRPAEATRLGRPAEATQPTSP